MSDYAEKLGWDFTREDFSDTDIPYSYVYSQKNSLNRFAYGMLVRQMTEYGMVSWHIWAVL